MRLKTRSLSIFNKLIISFTLVTLITTVLVGGLSYYNISHIQLNLMQENLLNIAYSARLLIDPTIHQTYTPGEEANPVYIDTTNKLGELAESTKTEYIYTLVKKDAATQFILDSSWESIIGDPYELTEEMEIAFSGNPSFTEKPYTDDFGTFISAYIPLFDDSGLVVAIIAADYDVSMIQERLNSVLFKMLLTCILSIIIAISISLISSLKIKKSILEIIRKTYDIVSNSGDLTQRIDIHSGDELEELGKYINQLIENIGVIIKAAINTTEEVNQSAYQVTTISTKMMCSSKDQTSSMRELTNTTETLVTSIGYISENTEKLASIADKTVQSGIVAKEKVKDTVKNAKSGQEDITALVTEISAVSDSVLKLSSSISEVVKSTDEIRGIIQIINNIANQTNLLAINAAIEAARAGEAGKGFAVVSDEIRKLAIDSSQATANISDLIANVEQIVQKTVSESEDTIKAIQLGVEMTQTTDKKFDAIFTTINEADSMLQHMISEIESVNSFVHRAIAATQEQSAGSEEILSISEDVCELSESIYTGSQEVVSTSEILTQNANELKEIISKFKI